MGSKPIHTHYAFAISSFLPFYAVLLYNMLLVTSRQIETELKESLYMSYKVVYSLSYGPCTNNKESTCVEKSASQTSFE